MVMDAELLLADTVDITATGDGSSKDFGGGDQHPLTYAVHVKGAVSGTNPTLDLTIDESDNGSTWRTFLSFEQITASGVYYATGKSDARYRRYGATIGGTDTPTFLDVTIAPELGGQYEDY